MSPEGDGGQRQPAVSSGDISSMTFPETDLLLESVVGSSTEFGETGVKSAKLTLDREVMNQVTLKKFSLNQTTDSEAQNTCQVDYTNILVCVRGYHL